MFYKIYATFKISDWHIKYFLRKMHTVRDFGTHDDAVKWEHYLRYWPFVRGIQRSTVNSPHKCQWRRALKLSLIRAWLNGWVNNREAGDLRRHRAHYGVPVMGDLYVIHLGLFH